MSENNSINYAIDLGTTNSVISHYHEGEVSTFKNPVGQKETLPSVVAFRRERIIVGDKAKEFLEKDPENVVGLFKRKMGTSHTYKIASIDKELTPIELSSYVLKEIKNFIQSDKQLEAVIITIPASFDTVQSNATKEAGTLAGFKEVFLLQEPIAAALSFMNKFVTDEEDKKWLVYDLGGGTFDVALVSLEEGELNIKDHKGDNFMGGLDIDNLLFEKLVLPELEKKGNFPEKLVQEFKGSNGKYHKYYYHIINKCEELKMTLSTSQVGEIEFELQDLDGNWVDLFLEVSRESFESIIKPIVINSISFVKDLLKDNSIDKNDISSILMVGGSTYIPLVKTLLKEELGIDIENRIDPISAVANGAAYYASTKKVIAKSVPLSDNEPVASINEEVNLKFKFAYQKQSQLSNEYFTALVSGDVDDYLYRIIRKDGGFDSGIKQLERRIEEDLSLISNSCNQFDLHVFDSSQNRVSFPTETIEINQGKFGVLGQPIPEDICLEIDDIEDENTGLQLIFKKNDLLPLRKTITKEVTRTIGKNSTDKIIINVLEGPQYASPSSNKPIGFIEIEAKDLTRDLIRGTDVEITIEMSESRDLTIKTFLNITDQEFANVFSSTNRYVNLERLKEEIFELLDVLLTQLDVANNNENYNQAAEIQGYEKEVRALYDQAMNLTEDDVTDSKFQIEDAKRRISHKIDIITSVGKSEEIIEDLQNWTSTLKYDIENTTGVTENHKAEFEKIAFQNDRVIGSGNKILIKSQIDKIIQLRHKVNNNDLGYMSSLFFHYAHFEDAYPSQKEKDKLVKEGEKAIEKENILILKAVVNKLYSLLPEEKKSQGFTGKSTGIN